MELKDLMTISGYPGLFRFISQGRNAIIVESVEDKKRMSAYSSSKISTLEEIAVFTESGELPLADLLRKMYGYSGGKEAISHKSPAGEIEQYFGSVLPEYDRERVYVSDMKKIIHWYNLLVRFDMLDPAPGDEKDSEKTGTGEPGSDKTDRDGGNPEADDTRPEGHPGRKAGRQIPGKFEGHTGGTLRSSGHQPGKSIRRQPRKS